MAISVTCGSCKTAFRVKDEHAGKRGKCPHCKASLVVPSSPPAEENTTPRQNAGVGASSHLILQEILQAFRGDIPPIRRTGAYHLGILLLTAAVLLLPAIYLALVAAVAYLIYYHVTVHLPVVIAMRHWAAIVTCTWAAIVGVILLFFMAAALRPGATTKVHGIWEEPLLLALVTRGPAVGAPSRNTDVVVR